MLDVALFDIFSQEVEVVLLGLINVSFFFVIAPEGVFPVPYLSQAHDFEEIGHKVLPSFVDLLNFSFNKGYELIWSLLDPPLQVAKAIINHLINDLPTFCINTHAAQWIFRVEANREVLADCVDLITSK